MAIFHLSFSNGKVGKGLAHFKYIMGEDRYSYKENEVIYEKHNMPPHVSAEDFWHSADAYERANGRVYKEIRIALPNGFTKKENQDLLNKFLEKEYDILTLDYTKCRMKAYDKKCYSCKKE